RPAGSAPALLMGRTEERRMDRCSGGVREPPAEVAALRVGRCQLERAAVGGGGVPVTSKSPEEVRAGGGEEVVAGERPALLDLVDELEPRGRPLRHRDRYGPVERH